MVEYCGNLCINSLSTCSESVADMRPFDHGELLMNFFPFLIVPCFKAVLVVVFVHYFVSFHQPRLDHIPSPMDDFMIFLDGYLIYGTIFCF